MNNNRYYLLTGAAGFLGTNICMQLLEAGCKVRALVLPNDKSVKFIPSEVEVVLGDLTDAASLEPFFTVPEGCTSVVIHCASMVTVNPNYSEKLMAVNVGGTRNIITKVLNHPECEKMVYVSSTGAIPEQPHGTPITEVSKFTPCDPKKVVGAYSQSKATATQMVLDAVQVMGLKACDVRDLAAGTIAAVDKGRIGECYILANKTVTLKEMCDMLHSECNAKKIKFYLPLGLANEQLREGGFDVKEAYQSVEDSVVGTYQKIEDGVVGGYQKIENGAVNGFRKVSDFFIKKFFSRKGETVEETRKRLSKK